MYTNDKNASSILVSVSNVNSVNIDLPSLDICLDIVYKLYQFYIERVVLAIGLISNMLNAIVFGILIKSEKNFKYDMFRYLFLKSIFDAFYLVTSLLSYINDCYKCWIKKQLIFLLFHWICLTYLGHVSALMSMFCEVAATFSRYRTLSQKFKFMDKIPIRITLALFAIYSMAFYSYKFFERNLVSSTIKNSTIIEYKLHYNAFGSSEIALNISFAHSLVRDCLCTIAIFVINLATLILMKKSMDRKQRLTINNVSRANYNENYKPERSPLSLPRNKTTPYRAKHAENKISLMVITTGIVACIGHGLTFIFNLPSMAMGSSICFYVITKFCYYSSFSVNFFIYYAFNKTFRACFLFKICRLEKCFKEKKKIMENMKRI